MLKKKDSHAFKCMTYLLQLNFIFIVLMVGDSGVGKTSFLNVFARGNSNFDGYTVPTTECSFKEGNIALKNKVIVQTWLWDSPGSTNLTQTSF